MIEHAHPEVTVRPVTPEEYDEWYHHSFGTYVDDLVRGTGTTRDVAEQRARKIYDDLLPDGLDSPRTWILRVLVHEQEGDGLVVDHPVGTLWIGPHGTRADAVFGLDIEIDEARRHQGLGRAAMEEAERILRAAGVKRVELTVFGFNDHARHLYESLGFSLISAQMGKDLD
jgi:GNAT superfamily N-acetyltransferase